MAKRTKQRYFEYVLIYNPTEGDDTAQIILNGTMLAEKKETAVRKLIRKIPDKWEEKMDDIDILVRDFQ